MLFNLIKLPEVWITSCRTKYIVPLGNNKLLKIQLIYSNKIIEDLIQEFKPALGEDYSKYKNHVYRVFSNCILIDDQKINEDKYAIASVFHDIGIWTDNTIDYLEPSIEQAKIYLLRTNKKNVIDEVTHMIYWHHKINNYKGKYEEIVEAFRKADFIDVSLGLINFGFDRQTIKENNIKFPKLGFHIFLIKRIIKNFFRHPLKPLPMFKK
jgi:hypothetical protein